MRGWFPHDLAVRGYGVVTAIALLAFVTFGTSVVCAKLLARRSPPGSPVALVPRLFLALVVACLTGLVFPGVRDMETKARRDDLDRRLTAELNARGCPVDEATLRRKRAELSLGNEMLPALAAVRRCSWNDSRMAARACAGASLNSSSVRVLRPHRCCPAPGRALPTISLPATQGCRVCT